MSVGSDWAYIEIYRDMLLKLIGATFIIDLHNSSQISETIWDFLTCSTKVSTVFILSKFFHQNYTERKLASPVAALTLQY